MVLIRLVGLAFLLAAYLLRRGWRKARERGYVGPRHRRVFRAVDPTRFNVAVAGQIFGAIVCFVAAVLCFTHGHSHGF